MVRHWAGGGWLGIVRVGMVRHCAGMVQIWKILLGIARVGQYLGIARVGMVRRCTGGDS